MKPWRQHNDLPFSWKLTRVGREERLSMMNAEVELIDSVGKRYPVAELRISDNVVSGVFRGKDQTNTGVFTLQITENRGKPNMFQFDVDAFCIVPTSALANKNYSMGDGSNAVGVDPLVVYTEISSPTNGIGISDIITSTSDEDSGVNTVKIMMDNGKSHTFTVKNGAKGKDGHTPVFDVIEDEPMKHVITVDGFPITVIRDGEGADLTLINQKLAQATALSEKANNAYEYFRKKEYTSIVNGLIEDNAIYTLGTLTGLVIKNIGSVKGETNIFFEVGDTPCFLQLSKPYGYVGELDASSRGKYVMSIVNGVVCLNKIKMA